MVSVASAALRSGSASAAVGTGRCPVSCDAEGRAFRAFESGFLAMTYLKHGQLHESIDSGQSVTGQSIGADADWVVAAGRGRTVRQRAGPSSFSCGRLRRDAWLQE